MTSTDVIRFVIFQITRYFSPVTVATEWALVTVFVGLIMFRAFRRLQGCRAVLIRCANQTTTAIIICGLLPIVLRLSLLGIVPVPDPSIHDEFSHLLLGDTLAHWRLTNPAHPLWQSFETIHVIQHPSYASMYLPGQGVFLAAGEVLFHEPWVGVLLSVGILFGCLCWMMQGWLPPAWAFYGTVLAILKIGVTGPWVNSYLGGPISAIGSALLIGCIPRLRGRQFSPLYGVLFGFGVLFLVNARPFEGGVLTLAAVVYIGYELLQMPAADRALFAKKIVVPASVVLVFGVAWTVYYCWRVTGALFYLPYQANRDTYGWPENPAFLAPKHLILRHKVLQDMLTKSLHNRDAYLSWDRLLDNLNNRVFDNWTFFVGPALTIPGLFVYKTYRSHKTVMLLVFLGLMLLLNLTQMVMFPYHFAPLVPLLFALLAQGVRALYREIFTVNQGRALNFVVALPFLLILVAGLKQAAPALNLPMSYWEVAREPHGEERANIQHWLSSQPGKQLVIVRYKPDHNPDQEWVYNEADIDGSRVVWARETNGEQDSKLLAYFHGRQVWLLNADVRPTRLVSYQNPPQTACASKLSQ